jgi:DNA invertase Pin-like site-specific DNA recombinase
MRVSSESDRQITDLQRDALLAVGVDGRHLFEDHASGAKDDRPGLTQALSFVRPGDVLVVWKLDRLGRSLSHLLCIVNTLKEKQVAFRSLTEGMDTTTASGELLFHVFGALAQYERAMTKERASLPDWLPPVAVGELAGALPPLLERSWTQLSVRCTTACPKRPCAATSPLSAPR